MAAQVAACTCVGMRTIEQREIAITIAEIDLRFIGRYQLSVMGIRVIKAVELVGIPFGHQILHLSVGGARFLA